MPKERGVNPVQAQRKADKAKAIKKGAPTSQVYMVKIDRLTTNFNRQGRTTDKA
jgi:hypothetical protein